MICDCYEFLKNTEDIVLNKKIFLSDFDWMENLLILKINYIRLLYLKFNYLLRFLDLFN